MTEKATQCPICMKGKREQDKYCSEKCAKTAVQVEAGEVIILNLQVPRGTR